MSAGAQQAGTTAPSPDSKLTTVLADLARSVAQEDTRHATTRRLGPTAALSADSMPRSVQDAMRGGLLRINANNEVQVYILLSEVTDATVAELTSAGVTIEIRDPGRRRVQARVAVSRLMAVAQLSSVDAVRLPTYARHRTGLVTSEGDAILHADAVRQQLSLDGTGVRVGVVSDGLKGVFAAGCATCAGVSGGPISTGDLPSASGVRNAQGVLTLSAGGIVGRSFQANSDLEGLPPSGSACAFPGAGAEGTALLEIVHDLAPGAKLSFANGDTDLAFNQAVNFLAASNDVVLDDIGFFGEPYDGTSGVSSNTAAALNNPKNPIRGYFTAVGNDADEHYFGTYADSHVDGTTVNGITTPGDLHLFQSSADTTDVLGLGAQPYNLISLPANGEVAVFLTWDDGFGASGNNYDLYLVQQSTGKVVASSTDVQNGKQDPVEAIDFVNKGGQDAFRIVVQNVRNAAQPRHLNIFSFQPECAGAGPQLLAPPRHERHNYNTASRSVSAQGDAGGSPVSVVSVGAICSASADAAGSFSASAPDQSCLDTSNSTAEFFSSRGPTLDGRTKPDITAIDGVTVFGAGGFPTTFFGTSAAAPHMGAIAALVLQSAPCLLNRATSTIDATAARTTLRNVITGHAVALSSASPDNTFGVGRADALGAVQATLPSFRGSAVISVDANTPFGASISASQLGFSDPNQCALTALNWKGDCGTSAGATMTCPVGGPLAATVAATNNGFGYSASTDLQITVTDFALASSPASATISAGQSAKYIVTAAPQGGPYRSEITLACSNVPAQATCAFNPPTLTPGAKVAQSILTISTSSGALTPPASVLPARPFAALRGWRPPLTAPMLAWPALMAMLWLGARRTNRRPTAAVAAVCVTVACLAVQGGARASAAPLAESAMASGIAIFPASLDLGSQTVGTTSVARVASLTNIGADPLVIGAITMVGDFAEVTNCGGSLAPGANCAISVTMTPTVAGSIAGTLRIADNAAGTPHTVTLVGTGVAAPTAGGATPAGSYTVTITGTVGTLAHATGVTLGIQ
jgi:Subtilase family